MPRSCFVPGCNTGYRSCKEKYSVFGIPKDRDLLLKWEKAIPRADRKLGLPNDVVCAKHFHESEIIREHKVIHDGHVLLSYPIRPKLVDGAVPSIFPNCPSYSSTKPNKPRKKSTRKLSYSPKKKKGTKRASDDDANEVNEEYRPGIESREELGMNGTEDSMSQSKNTNGDIFNDLKSNIANLKINSESWSIFSNSSNPQFISVAQMKISTEMKPYISRQLLIIDDMKIQIYLNESSIDTALILPSEFVLRTVDDLQEIIERLSSVPMCEGGAKKSYFPNATPERAAVDASGMWRHVECTLSVREGMKQCKFCSTLPKVLSRNCNNNLSRKPRKFTRLANIAVAKWVVSSARKSSYQKTKKLCSVRRKVQLTRLQLNGVREERDGKSVNAKA